MRCWPRPNSIPTQRSCPCFFLAHAPDSNCATHFSWAASFCLIWIFMNVVRRPHSIIREIAWHGAPNPFTLLMSVWEPCTSSNCSLHFAMPGCHKCCWCYGEKWEAEKQYGLSVASSQVRKNKIDAGERWMAFSRLQARIKSTKSMRWKRMLTWSLLPESSMSQTFRPEVNKKKTPPIGNKVAACHCTCTWVLPRYLYFQ